MDLGFDRTRTYIVYLKVRRAERHRVDGGSHLKAPRADRHRAYHYTISFSKRATPFVASFLHVNGGEGASLA